jgi:ABC-2 type transport system permease protein
MAVYKRHYKPYNGRLTPGWSRLFVPAKYSLEVLFKSRLLIAYLVACYVFPLICGAMIYLRYNLSALDTLKIKPDNLVAIDNEFFAVFLSVQAFFSFLLTAYAAPGTISPDLTNNALPLYLCRPISKAEYVLGKMSVLLIPLSLITWVPGLLLWSIQAGLNTEGWGRQNVGLAFGVFIGAWLWILVLALLGLALSAWVRWKIAASALLFGVFFISAAFSAIVNEVLETKLGYLLNLGHLLGTIWAKILNIQPRETLLGALFNVRRGDEVPYWAAWLMLAAICAVCIWMLNRKLKGREVIS